MSGPSIHLELCSLVSQAKIVRHKDEQAACNGNGEHRVLEQEGDRAKQGQTRG